MAVVLGALVAASCTGAGIERFVSDRPQELEASQGEPRCGRPPIQREDPNPVEGEAPPPEVGRVADGVEEVRGLDFRAPVSADPVSRDELQRRIVRSIDRDFPREETERRQRAWETIGVIPEGTRLLQAVRDLSANQVIGLYDTTNDDLLFLGDDASSPLERLVLSHELTHALDDQWFDLSRGDRLASTCQEDRLEAFVALAEGDAQAMSQRWAARNFTVQDFADLSQEAAGFAPPPATVAPFVRSMLEFPYSSGQAFVNALLERGGRDALDGAFRNPPVSTEQILHPERYPDDRPVPVEPPNLAPALGPEWEEIDALDVGEGWLMMMLQLRLGADRSEEAAAGWGGGRYRAFATQDQVAVVLETEWDSEEDAEEFARAVEDWVGDHSATVQDRGAGVRVLWGSDGAALGEVERASGRSA